MKRLIQVTMAVLASLLLVGSVALAQSAPQFQLGFKALADQIPDVCGTPLEDEHWGSNGDSLQQTTKGLMVWRKADNWTAFTNGSRTWINGPTGAQERGNSERFEWEAVVTAPPPAPAPTQAPAAPQPTPVPAPAPQPTAVPTQAPPPPPPPAAAPAAPAAQPMISKDKASTAVLKLSDLAPGYETLTLGWNAEEWLEGQYHTTGRNYRSGPYVSTRFIIYESEASAQASLTRASISGFREQDAPLSNVASAKALTLTAKLGDTGEQSSDYYVFFRVGNVLARVRTYGFTFNTTMDQTMRLSQLVANRLATP